MSNLLVDLMEGLTLSGSVIFLSLQLFLFVRDLVKLMQTLRP